MRMPELLSTLMRSVGMAQADTQSLRPLSWRQRALDTCRSKHPLRRPKSNERDRGYRSQWQTPFRQYALKLMRDGGFQGTPHGFRSAFKRLGCQTGSSR